MAAVEDSAEGKNFTDDFAGDKEKWIRFLTQYDMLILGFMDSAMFTTDEVFNAGFEEFVREGKSVIISHDMLCDTGIAWTYFTTGGNTYLDDTMKNYITKITNLREMGGQLKKYFIPLLFTQMNGFVVHY